MRPRDRLIVVSVLIVVGGALPACGDATDANQVEGSDQQSGGPAQGQSGSSEPERFDGVASEFPYTGQQVFRLFYMQGLYLHRGESADRIALNTVATPQQRDAVMARYGTFSVGIAYDRDAMQRLLSEPNTRQLLQPDADDVYWYREPGMYGLPGAWFALKRYGNVVASWMAGGERRTDEHWERINAELERLPPP